MEPDDGESLVGEDAVAEAVDSVPVGAAVTDLGPDSMSHTNSHDLLIIKLQYKVEEYFLVYCNLSMGCS